MSEGQSGPDRQPAPRTKKRGRRTLILLLALVAAIFAGLALLRHAFDGIEQEAIRYERWWRFGYASVGSALPGTPDLANLDARLNAHGVALGAPIFIRIFKREFELELWMMRDGRFHRVATYPICRWSGRLGPKIRQGDAQAPEGFYTVDASALNPNSRWHRSFNLGYPNAYDQSHGRTGSLLMVHGGCSSIGCFAMTNGVITEIWRIVTAALDRGQKRFQVQVFPFRLTDGNLAGRTDGPLLGFWRNLKVGYDHFERDLLPPVVNVCDKTYTFAPAGKNADGSAPITVECNDRNGT